MPITRILRLAAAIVAVSSAAGAQWATRCVGQQSQADFGYDAIDCTNCEINGHNQPWIVFHGEPTLRSIRKGGPADGVLREGDTLVAVDGKSITTSAGSERYANARAGDTVQFAVRRAGGVMKVMLVAAQKCVRAQQSGFALSPSAPWGLRVGDGKVNVVFAPRIGLDGRWMLNRPPLRRLPRGWMGFGVIRMMRRDSTDRNEELSQPFGAIPEIAVVAPDSPAARAGFVPGDSVISVDGVSLLTQAGAEKLRSPVPGVPLNVVLRRGGVDRHVTIVPDSAPVNPPTIAGEGRGRGEY